MGRVHAEGVGIEYEVVGQGHPVVLLRGTSDPALTEIQMTDSAQNVAGRWRYERLDGPGHWMQLEAPEQVNALLLDFLPR